MSAMGLQLVAASGAVTMTSREIADLVESRHDKVKQSIERLAARDLIALPPLGEYLDGLGRPAQQYLVGKRDSYVVVAQLSPEFTARLVDRWQELEAKQADPLASLPPEQRALVAVMVDNVAIKAEQAKQAASIAAIEQRVDQAAETHLMLARPAASEPIVHIRERINKKYGLPTRIIDEVIRQSPYAPKPAGMVKNAHENAMGGSYAVYWTKDVNSVFARFVSECHHETATQATHPLIDGRFKLNGSLQ